MNSVTPYLFFDGECREALEFYRRALGGDLTLMTYGQAQGEGCPVGAKDRIIHGALKSGELFLMASDTPDEAPDRGDDVQLFLSCSSLEQLEERFKALSDGGEATVPLHDAFWGSRFGMAVDRYGFRWMLGCELKKG